MSEFLPIFLVQLPVTASHGEDNLVEESVCEVHERFMSVGLPALRDRIESMRVCGQVEVPGFVNAKLPEWSMG
jgi:hypothetical protein